VISNHHRKVEIVMQILVDSSILVVLLESLIAFLCLIGLGLYRFSRGVMYRLWSAAWILFSITTTVVIFATSSVGLSLVDAVASGGVVLSALLLVDGTHERRRRNNNSVLLYPAAFAGGFALVPIGIIFNLSYGMVFTPGAFLITYACFSSVIQFRKINPTRDFDYWTLIIGLIVWGSTMVFFPLSIFVDTFVLQLIFTTTGLIMTGAGMLNVFIRETTEDLKVQNSITQLMSGIVNHDIRNYVATLQESISQMQTSSTDQKFWLDLSSEAISSMADFVKEIRHISAGITRFEAERIPIDMNSLLNEVKKRVTREYDLTRDAISITIDEDTTVLTNTIVRELFWNIIDNAFKHGSEHLNIIETGSTQDVVKLEIRDDAGGLRTDVFEFLNDPDSLSSTAAPGMGLGIILIRGLSILCGVKLEVDHIGEDGQLVGTVFKLHFNRHSSLET
jgi:signal transduction histidine kinase